MLFPPMKPSENLKATRVAVCRKKKRKKRQQEIGFNKLPEEKQLFALKIFLEQFKSPLIYILVIAGAVTLVLKEYANTAVILGAVF